MKKIHDQAARNFCTVKKTCLWLSCLIALLILAGQSQAATEKYVLDFGDEEFYGQDQTIFLKQALRQQYPWLRLEGSDLERVVLVAKSRFGKGQARLRVGQDYSGPYQVHGHPKRFNSNHHKSYDRIAMENPSGRYGSHGPWQISLDGNFKVRKVIVVLSERRQHPGHWRDHRWYGGGNWHHSR